MPFSALSAHVIGGAWALLVVRFRWLHHLLFVLLFDRRSPAYGEYVFAFIWTGIAVLLGNLILAAGLILLFDDHHSHGR